MLQIFSILLLKHFWMKVRKLMCMQKIIVLAVTAVKMEMLELVNIVLYYVQYLG
jgi:hypothetical protein